MASTARLRSLALLACLVLAPAAPARADIDAAVAAYAAGDFETALDGFTELAEAGVVLAQTSLARMYALGEGTEADPARAAHWLDRAARGGDAAAQLALGAMHYHGEGVERSAPLAYAWFNLAATNGRDEALDYMHGLLEELDPADLDRAQRLARRLFEEHGDQDLEGLLAAPEKE